MRPPSADGTATSSSDADPCLLEVLEEVREILERPPHKSATGFSRRGRGSQKDKGTRTHLRRSSFQKIREKFRLFLAKFSRASREPVALSDVLVSEGEENGEINGARFGGLFYHV